MDPFGELERYSRQILFAPIGLDGQRKLRAASVLVVGCGALGSAVLEQLARAGVGRLRFVDRDFVELSNLQRQMLYTERDAAERLPKAVAARRALAALNSEPEYDARVADFNHLNAESLAGGMNLILDGTDNFETRFLINEVAVKHELPYIYGACLGSTGTCMPVIPGRTPCLQCLIPQPPERTSLPTCDTVGILAPAVRLVAALEAAYALRILVDGPASAAPLLTQLDCWSAEFVNVDMTAAQQPDCPVCGRRQFRFLSGAEATQAVSLCGRNTVQIHFPPGDPGRPQRVDFARLAERLARLGPTQWNEYLLTFSVPPYELVLFPDGRCLVKGTDDPAVAKSIYSRFIGM
jgi:molybdopterin/thiamine biosynthesis adenylyltransferase